MLCNLTNLNVKVQNLKILVMKMTWMVEYKIKFVVVSTNSMRDTQIQSKYQETKESVVISMNIMRGTQKHHNYLLTYENERAIYLSTLATWELQMGALLLLWDQQGVSEAPESCHDSSVACAARHGLLQRLHELQPLQQLLQNDELLWRR